MVVGIETKYHEHLSKEKKPTTDKAEAVSRHADQTDFLVELAEESDVFKPGWHDKVLNTGLRQIWRDHLLALSMRNHPDGWTSHTRYVLLYPRRNVSFTAAAGSYLDLLVDGDTSFQAHTVEDVLDAAFAHGGTTQDNFRRRYLW